MPSRLDDCIILHGSRTLRCTAKVDKHFIDYCTLQFISAGAVDLTYNARAWHLPPNWLWPCIPGPHIRFHAAAGHTWWSHRYIAVRGPLVDAWRRDGLWPEEPLQVPAGVDVAAAFDAIYVLMADESAWSRRRVVNRLEDLLLTLAAARCSPSDAPWLLRAREALDQAPIPLEVTRIAEDCGMSEVTFRRRFTAALGMSPRDFAISARIERACAHLLTSDIPIAVIATALGYPDLSFFSRQFRQRTGMTPRAYRLSQQG